VTTPPVVSTPTQVRHPWRASVRTAIATAVWALPVVPLVAHELGIEELGWVAAIVGGAAGITRVIAIPIVNAKLTQWLNLGAAPK
jgi:hypothetical protein